MTNAAPLRPVRVQCGCSTSLHFGFVGWLTIRCLLTCKSASSRWPCLHSHGLLFSSTSYAYGPALLLVRVLVRVRVLVHALCFSGKLPFRAHIVQSACSWNRAFCSVVIALSAGHGMGQWRQQQAIRIKQCCQAIRFQANNVSSGRKLPSNDSCFSPPFFVLVQYRYSGSS